jgi:hypothetical protein
MVIAYAILFYRGIRNWLGFGKVERPVYYAPSRSGEGETTSQITILIPRFENLRTISAPIPLEPPVMRTTSFDQSHDSSYSKLFKLRVDKYELRCTSDFQVHSMQVGIRNVFDNRNFCKKLRVLGRMV